MHFGKEFQCEHCEKMFKHSDSLRLHIGIEHNGVRFTCDFCGFKFKQAAHLRRHLSAQHEGMHQEIGSKRKETATKKVKEFLCHLCIVSYNRKEKLKNHLLAEHYEVYQDVGSTVNQVAQTIQYSSNVDINEEIIYPCNLCGVSFNQASYLKKHLAKLHNTDYSQNFKLNK